MHCEFQGQTIGRARECERSRKSCRTKKRDAQGGASQISSSLLVVWSIQNSIRKNGLKTIELTTGRKWSGGIHTGCSSWVESHWKTWNNQFSNAVSGSFRYQIDINHSLSKYCFGEDKTIKYIPWRSLCVACHVISLSVRCKLSSMFHLFVRRNSLLCPIHYIGKNREPFGWKMLNNNKSYLNCISTAKFERSKQKRTSRYLVGRWWIQSEY